MRPVISGYACMDFPPHSPPSQPLNLTKKRINKKEIMEANEGKYTFGVVIPGWKLAIWVFWWSYLGRNISEMSLRDFLFSGLSCFSGLFKRGNVPSFTYVC